MNLNYMKSYSTIQERIKLIAEKFFNGNITAMAKSTFISRTTINSIIGEKEVSPGYEVIRRIVDNSSLNISSDWLITGKGDMLKSAASPAINHEYKGAPYYDVDFIGGFDMVLNNQTVNPDYYIDFEPYNKPGVKWCNITGHSMEPAINHGDMIAIKEVQDWQSYISYGEIYAIVTTNDMRTVKKIRKGNTEEQYRLIPINATDYDEQNIEKNKISKVFEVLGCMKRF